MASSGQFELQKQLEIPEEISSKNHRSRQFLLEILTNPASLGAPAAPYPTEAPKEQQD